MKNFIIGLIIGAIIGGVGIALADIGVLYNSLNQPVGIDGSPIYIEIVQ